MRSTAGGRAAGLALIALLAAAVVWTPPARAGGPDAGPDAEADPSRSYVVQPGDTLSGIAQRHGVTLDALWAANPEIRDVNLIRVGQTLILPLPGMDAAPIEPFLTPPVLGRVSAVRRWGAPNGDYGVHRAIDFFVPAGTPVFAPMGGRLMAAGPVADDVCATRGIAIDDGGDNLVWVLHLGLIAVERGDEIQAGRLLGTVRHRDPCIFGLPDHTHLELFRRGPDGRRRVVDPEPYLQRPITAPDYVPPEEEAAGPG